MIPSPKTTRPTGGAPDLRPRAAALLDDGRIDVDALLASLVVAWRARGLRVLGLVMTHPAGRGDCAAPMVLVDVDTHEAYLVSQDLGPGSTACRADVQGFTRASAVLRDAGARGADLVISNRFGGLEVLGGGFTAELLDLMARDVPVLTVVASRHLDAWDRFTGGAAVLPAEPAAADAWLAAVLAHAGAPR